MGSRGEFGDHDDDCNNMRKIGPGFLSCHATFNSDIRTMELLVISAERLIGRKRNCILEEKGGGEYIVFNLGLTLQREQAGIPVTIIKTHRERMISP